VLSIFPKRHHPEEANSIWWSGLYCREEVMNQIEAKQNLRLLCDEIEKLQNLSRGLMTAKEMIDVDGKIRRHRQQVKNIKVMLMISNRL